MIRSMRRNWIRLRPKRQDKPGKREKTAFSDRSGSSGSVTLYFVIATATFFLLTALLIDFARVAAFRKQAELSVKSGIRSALSSYDPLVYAKYGLFIRGGESANDVFRAALEGNASTGETDAFSFLDTRWEQAEVTESRPLADYGVFRRQVLEEMKYKAPIDLAVEVASRFRSVTGTMKEATRTVDLLESMRKAYDRREEALDLALEAQRKHGDEVGRTVDSAIGGAAGTVGGYEDYVRKRLDDEQRRESLRRWEEEKTKREAEGENPEEIEKDRPEGPRYEAEAAAYEKSAVDAARALQQASDKARKETERFWTEAKEAWAKAKQANDEMIAVLERAKSEPASPGDAGTGEESIDPEHKRTMEELRKSTEELILKPPYFEEYATEIDRQHAQGLTVAAEASAFSSAVGSAPGSTGLGAALRDGQRQAQETLAAFAGDYGSGGRVVEARHADMQARRSHDEERKRMENQAKGEWTKATSFLGSFGQAAGNAEEQEGFRRTAELYRNNLEWNQSEEEHAAKARSGDPSVGRDEAMASSGGLMELMQGSLLGARDQLYYSEYAIGRLSHFGPSSANRLLKGEQVSLGVHEQETEYVLYGLSRPAGNIAASYGEIFGFRLAIRTMEGLIECRTMGHPLLVLAASLVYGITKAMEDMASLLNAGKIQLSKYSRVDTY